MVVEVRLSQFGMGMQDGKILQWYVAEGNAVKQGQPLCEIEAAKTVVDIESPAAGILTRIVVPIEETAQVRDVIAIIDDGQREAGDVASAGAAFVPDRIRSAATPGATVDRVSHTDARPQLQIEPRARRRASELGIDLAQLQGTGPGGRITATDVEHAAAGLTPQDTARAADFEDVPLSSMRRTLARRVTESKQTIPHFYVKAHCNAENLLALRHRLNILGTGIKISVNVLIVKAAAQALRQVPAANVSWRDTAVRHHHCIDVSVAVAAADGLFTPVVRDADSKSPRELAAEIAGLVEQARQGALAPAQYVGGSLTISNLGMYAVEEFIAILNPPQALILAVGAAKPRPVIIDNTVGIANVLTATLSVDHRAIDGATAGRFMHAFQAAVEAADFGS